MTFYICLAYVVVLVVSYCFSWFQHKKGGSREEELKSDILLYVMNPMFLTFCVVSVFYGSSWVYILAGVLAEAWYAIYLGLMRKKINTEAHIGNSFLVLLVMAIVSGAMYLFK